MNKTVKTLAVVVSSLFVLSFVVVVINQTAGVVQLAKEVHPLAGTVTLWGLLIAYAGMIAVPVVLVVRMPKPLEPPEAEGTPEFDDYLKQLGRRLANNPRIKLAAIEPVGRPSIEKAIQILDDDANAIVKQTATAVFLTTAVSQSGRLDALLVLAAQSRMVWKIARLYYQRPSLRELTHLYANVAMTSFAAGELDDLELHQMIQPVVAGTLGAAGGVVPGFQVLTTILVNSLLSGSANSFLTLRVGMIAKDYCGSLVAEPRSQIRRAASAEAARLLSSIVKESGARVREAIWREIKSKIPRPWPLKKGHPEAV
jgi:hypothetical protein